MEPIGNSPAEFAAAMAAEAPKWTKLIKEVGIKAAEESRVPGERKRDPGPFQIPSA